MAQLENLELEVNVATTTVNAWGPLLNNHLQDIPTHIQEIAHHGIHRGATMALAAAQVQTGHDLRTMELGFPMGDDSSTHEDLIEDFEDTAAAIVDIASAQDIVNRVFDQLVTYQ